MPDAPAVAASATPAAPAPNAAPPATTPAAVAPPPAAETAQAAQPPAQELTPEQAAAKRQANIERHNKLKELEAVKQKRFAAERDALAQEKARIAEDIRLASEYRRLAELQRTDPLAYLEAVKLSVPDISRRFLEKQTGATKSPAQLAQEAAREEWSRIQAEQKAAADKAAEEKARSDNEARIKAQQDTHASTLKQFEQIIQSDKSAFRHMSALGRPALDLAWEMAERAFVANGKKLDGMPSFKEIVAGTEHHIRQQLKQQDEAEAAAESAKAVDPKAKAAASLAKGKTQDGVKTPSPTLSPKQRRLQPITDYRSLAKGLIAEAQAKKAATNDS